MTTNRVYTEKGCAADYLYIFAYKDEHRDEMPAEAEEDMKAYKAIYGME